MNSSTGFVFSLIPLSIIMGFWLHFACRVYSVCSSRSLPSVAAFL